MGGYTKTEKMNYENFGYHNYAEFVEDLNNLLVHEYGIEHGIMFQLKRFDYRQPEYGRTLQNHAITFDISKGCDKVQLVKNFFNNGKTLVCDGRQMFETWKVTRDIEECIIFNPL